MPWLDQCREWVERYDPVRPEMLQGLHHYGFVRRLSELLPANAIVVSDTGGNVIMMGHAFKSKAGQRIFSSNGNTPMGFALCGAFGAWFAEPTRPIICIIGDGGMQLNIQELQTVRKYNVPLKVFILNNGILGNTKSYQRVNGKAELACGPDGYSAPNFEEIVRGYNIRPAKVIEGWQDQLQWFIDIPGPYVCDVSHYDFCTYEPRMSRWDAAIEEMYPPLPEQEFEENMCVQPLEGWRTRR